MHRLLVMVVVGLLVVAGPAWAKEKPAQSCGDDHQEDFDPGLESRTVVAGPVAFVPFRVQPDESGNSPARAFKLAVRLDADTDATLRIRTPDTSLLFDPDDFDQDRYRLDDGDRKIRITGCEDRSAMFVGAVLTSGPTTFEVDVKARGFPKVRVTLTVYAG